MNRAPASNPRPASARPAHVSLRDRCRELGVPVWRYSATGHILASPNEPGVVGQWLASAAIERLIEKQVQQWQGSDEPRPAQPFPGCTLVPLSDQHRRRRGAVSVAMILSRRALDSEQFLLACQAAMLDARAARKAIEPVARFGDDDAEAVARMLGWMHEDLRGALDAEQKVMQFSRQLTECYGEISLLYRLGQSMNALEEPLRFVRLACEELHAVLSFGWIAACFLDEVPEARSLQAQTIVSGEAPTPASDFAPRARELVREAARDGRSIIDGASSSGLATPDAQVLVHTVSHRGVVVGGILASAKQGDDRLVSSSDQKMIGAAAGSLSVLLENAWLYEDKQAMFLGTLEALTTSIDAKDPYTCGHSERVAHLAAELALALGMSREQAERIRIAGLVHDIGKIGVPEGVLCKPGRLTDEEFDLIKKHPEIGEHILRDIPLLGDVLPGVLSHHERFDGRGYPHRLAGEDIPLMARIIGLADSFDAMSSNRTYRAAMNRETVLGEVRKGAGTQFDPALAKVFLTLDFSTYDEMVARHHRQATAGDDRFGRPSLGKAPASQNPATQKEAA
ncbi:MAG: HD-GYP domain-containing protein [Planctomycetes bacterium]|nr:HD-GYP domain-containing protein [Planctomycetota bacterium]